MAQKSVPVKFGVWTRITDSVDQEFTATNASGVTLAVLWSTQDLDGNAPTSDQLDAAWNVNNGLPFQRLETTEISTHCFVVMRTSKHDVNSRPLVKII